MAEKAKTGKVTAKTTVRVTDLDRGRAAPRPDPVIAEVAGRDDAGPGRSDSGVIPDVSLIVRIDLGPHGRLGPGKVLLLRRIEQSGSISAAARSMNMSYRQAWDLVDQLNSAFDELVVSSQTGGKAGGGAILTPFGKELVETVQGITALAEEAAAARVAALRAKLRPAACSDGTSAEADIDPAAGE